LTLSGQACRWGTTSGEPREVRNASTIVCHSGLEQVGPEFLGFIRATSSQRIIARELRFAGVNIMIPTACAQGTMRLPMLSTVLRAGAPDLMLAVAPTLSLVSPTPVFAQLGP